RGETRRGYKWLLGAAATLLAAACAHAAATPSEEAGPPPAHATTPDGAALYQSRCASCHDNATDRTPTREVLSKNPPSFILASMKSGAMVPMAAGLSDAEMIAIARHVSEVDTGPLADVD